MVAAPGSVLYQPLVIVVVAVAAGITFDRYVQNAMALAAWWTLAACCLVVWWLLWRGRHEVLAAWLLLAAAALTGAAWHHLQWHLFDRYEIGRYAPNELAPACVEAVARESPERVPAPRPTPLRAIPGNERSRLRVAVARIRDGETWRPASGECQIIVEGHLLGVHPGDRLRIFGQLARVNPPLNPGEFDFAVHARADRQLVRLRASAPESVEVTGRPSSWGWERLLESIRKVGRRIVRDFVGPRRAALASAVLLGAREGLPSEETDSFFVTGTIHLLVVSGLHVGVLAMGLYALMRLGWLPRRTSLAVIMAVVVAYALVAEARPPVVRGATLTVLMCLAALTGRRAVAFNSLAAAALTVLAINPGELFRIGTQLSFLAVASLISVNNLAVLQRRFCTDRLDQLIAAARPRHVRVVTWMGRWLGWMLLATGAVWLTALPLVLHQFHVVAPIAVLINPVVWVLVVLALWSGFAMLLAGWLMPFLGAVFGAACNTSLAGLEGVVAWAESLPAGHFWAPGPAWWWVLVFYLGLLAAMIRGRTLVPRRWQLATLCVWVLIGLVPSLTRPWMRDGLDCSFVAVGHGTSVVLQSPTGETLLYDAGALGSPESATQSIASYLWRRGILRIDAIVISHADVDHYNAVPGLLERFRVGAIYVSPMMFDGFDDPGASGGPFVLREAIQTAGVPIREIWSGDRLRVGPDVAAHVIHPPRSGVVGSDNANSITLAVEYAERRVLLPGDLESPGLEDVVAELPYDCDVLLAPHHGSRRSDPPGFAAWSTPDWVVISGGASDEVLPVVQTYRRAGAQVLRTNERGTVHFSIQAGSLQMATWLADGR